MARNQIYRGNPELKQSIIFDNFSGGINTTDLDEQMLTNEFRLLRNVELKERGRIQNRKGFDTLKPFNEWLEAQAVSLPDGHYYLFYPLVDEFSTFEKMKEYNTFDEFKNYYEPIPINMVFFIGVIEGLNLNFYTLNFSHTKGSLTYAVTSQLERTVSLTIGDTRRDKKLTGINIETYDGRYYIMLNEIIEDIQGIFEFYYDEGQVYTNIYDRNNSYMPNPYEISNVGFNLLSETPTRYIRGNISSVDEIRGMFLTEVNKDNVILSNIPRSGEFILNIMYNGTVDFARTINIECYYEDDYGEKINIDITKAIQSGNIGTGLIRYRIRLGKVVSNEIFIKASKSVSNLDIPYVREFSSLEDAVSFYKTNETNKCVIEKLSDSYVNLYVPDLVKTYGYEFDSYSKSVYAGNGYVTITGTSENMPYIISNSFTGSDLEYTKLYKEHAGEFVYTVVYDAYRTDPTYSVKLIRYDDNGAPTNTYYYDTIETYLEAKITYTMTEFLPDPFNNIRINIEGEVSRSTVNEASGTTYDVSLEGSFASIVQIKTYILDNYDLPEHDGDVFRANLYNSTAGTCLIDAYVDLSYASKKSCEMDGGFWVSDADANQYVYYTLIYEPYTVVPVTKDYYIYNGGTAGDVEDFDRVEVEQTLDIINFTDRFTVANQEQKVIKPLDLKNAKHIIIKDRMFIYSGNTIIVSDPYSNLDNKSFSYFPNYNYIVLNLEAKDQIQKIAYFRGSYLVFTKQKIVRMSGEFMSEDFILVTINDTLGCIAPDSIRGINNTLIFMSEDGLYTVKQNFYQDGLENLDKIDRQVKGIIPHGTKHESLLYNEQYMLFVKDEDNKYIKTVKQYYNMQYATKTYPYVVDEYVKVPEMMFKVSTDLIALKDGKIWTYDVGYTDFAPDDATQEEIEEHTYKWTVVTPYWSLGYPLHEKKFKNFFIKLDSDTLTPVYFTIYVDKLAFSTSFEYLAKLNEFGEVEYYKIVNPVDLQTTVDSETNIVVETTPTQYMLDPDLVLGDFELGRDTLNETKYQVHKILLGGSAKGKSLAIQIEQKKNSYFGLDSIGLIYKLGKMRESR